MPCAKFHSNHFTISWMRAKWNFYWILNYDGKTLSSNGALASNDKRPSYLALTDKLGARVYNEYLWENWPLDNGAPVYCASNGGIKILSSHWFMVCEIADDLRPFNLHLQYCIQYGIDNLFALLARKYKIRLPDIIFRWFSARLQYLQCVSNGDTAVLH